MDARSLARSGGEPGRARFVVAGSEPLPFVGRGIRWTRAPRVQPRNGLALTLRGLADVTADLARARLDASRPLELRVDTDGPAVLRLTGAFSPQVRVVDAANGRPVPTRLDGSVLSIGLAGGTYGLAVLPD